MADKMSPEFAQLLNERKLLRIAPRRNIVLKEIEGAQSDLRDAEDSFQRRKFKWANTGILFHAS